MSLVFFFHDVDGIAPACQNVAFLDYKVEKCSEAREERLVLDDCFVVSKVAA